MNYAQNITFYPFFSIKAVVIQQNVSCFQIVSTMYWLYILVSLRMPRLHLSWLYVGHVRITKQPSSFRGIHFWCNSKGNLNGKILKVHSCAQTWYLSILKCDSRVVVHSSIWTLCLPNCAYGAHKACFYAEALSPRQSSECVFA